jgi:hypothetical protein
MRGLVLQALMQSMSRRRAVVISALFFAVAHGAIERMPGTFLLGLLYGWMFVRTGSLLPGMIAHALHNGTVLVLYRARMMPGAERSLIPTDVYGLLPAWMVGAAVALVVAGMMLVPKTRLWPEDPGWKSPEEIEEESYDAAA